MKVTLHGLVSMTVTLVPIHVCRDYTVRAVKCLGILAVENVIFAFLALNMLNIRGKRLSVGFQYAPYYLK